MVLSACRCRFHICNRSCRIIYEKIAIFIYFSQKQKYLDDFNENCCETGISWRFLHTVYPSKSIKISHFRFTLIFCRVFVICRVCLPEIGSCLLLVVKCWLLIVGCRCWWSSLLVPGGRALVVGCCLLIVSVCCRLLFPLSGPALSEYVLDNVSEKFG